MSCFTPTPAGATQHGVTAGVTEGAWVPCLRSTRTRKCAVSNWPSTWHRNEIPLAGNVLKGCTERQVASAGCVGVAGVCCGCGRRGQHDPGWPARQGEHTHLPLPEELGSGGRRWVPRCTDADSSRVSWREDPGQSLSVLKTDGAPARALLQNEGLGRKM